VDIRVVFQYCTAPLRGEEAVAMAGRTGQP
jgi:hypothetical protein